MSGSALDQVEGFPPIAAPDARILILGSAPSVESLRQQQYYAHPRNSFWPILYSLLCDITIEQVELPDYSERGAVLTTHQIALWDVMASCERPGSLDSAITHQSILTNPFKPFFDHHPQIHTLFFNGAKAEEIYRKRVLPGLPERQQQLKRVRLPSTSPAMAALSWGEKQQQWQVILEAVRSQHF